MNKKIQLVLILSVLHSLFFFVGQYMIDDQAKLVVAVIYSWFVLMVGTGLTTIGVKGTDIVGRFMIATTVQMMGILAFVLALWYKKIPSALELALFLLVTFLVGMVFQSIYLVKQVNPKK